LQTKSLLYHRDNSDRQAKDETNLELIFQDDMTQLPLSSTRTFVEGDDSFSRTSSSGTIGFSDMTGSLSRYPLKRRFLDYTKAGIPTREKKEASKIRSTGTAIRVDLYRSSFSVLGCWILTTFSFQFTTSLMRNPPQARKCSQCTPKSIFFQAKRNKNRLDEDDLNRWYDDVDDDATPDKVFWQEMERQRLLNRVNDGSEDVQQPSSSIMTAAAEISSSSSSNQGSSYNVPPPMSGFGGVYGSAPTSTVSGSSIASGSGTTNGSSTTPFKSSTSSSSSSFFDNMLPTQQKQVWRQPVPTMEQIKMAEATLAQYELFQVADNWIDEDLQKQMDVLQTEIEDAEDSKGKQDGEATAVSTNSDVVG
jgi:hypothetical protein